MASFDFVRDKLTEWNHSDLIQRFEDEEIDEESFLSLKEKDFINLIPKIGPRSAFREKHKAFIKKQKQPDDDKNIQAATWSSVSIKASKSSSENITGEMVNQEPRQKNIKPRNQTPKRSETKRSLDKLLGTCGGSVPTTNTSGVGETVYDQSEPSTCHGCRKEKRTKVQRKRKSDEAHANKQTKKRQCVAASRITETFETETKTEVKKIMQHVKSKLDDLPSTKLIDFLRGKIQTLEKDKKEIVGVFGKTGAGKSFLINTILGETKLLPSGNQGACTSVMIQVEANMTDSKYIAEIEFMTEEEWKEELLSILRDRSYKDGNDEDHERDDDDDDDEKISSLYGKDGRGATLEELMDRKHFRKIPEFRLSVKKIFLCDTAEKLSETITCYTRSDTQSDTFKRQYWPLVKCITIKVPNSKDLLEDVVLVDLPGNGDCNKSRDEMWKSFVGNCSAVWIVSDIARATSEKESWEILDSTVSLFGPGGECRSISFICTKTDDIEENQKADARTCILRRNETTKRQVRDKFNKQKEVKKHFSGGKDFLQVFTVSSKEYQKEKHLQQEETEIPKLQEFLRNLNDRRTKTSGYVSGAYGILSLIEGAKSSDMTDSKEEVCQVLEQRLKDEIKSIGQTIYEAYETFERCLSEGVRQSEESCEKLMNKVIAPDHIMMQLKCKLQESMDLSLKTPNSSFLPDDVTVEYNKMKMYYEKLMGCSSTVQFTPRLDLHTKTKVFESQSGNSRKCVQVSTSVTMLNPEIVKELTTHDRKPTYRLQCPKAGLFQCSSTGLVFLMEGKGDVVYMMTQWDSRLLGSMTPAGPLFSIDCSEQSVRQLHLPHCMCDEKDEKLSVAHVTDGNMEIVQPLKTTATHVIVNITHLSLFGLIRDVFSILPVRSQVLLFLQPQGNRPQNCILNVILLPKNVPLCEVEHQQKGSTFIQSSSNCTLSPRGKYGLCCELVANSRIQPTSGQFDYDYSPNFHPTFQVFLDGMSGAENIRLSLLDRGRNDQIVWECLIPTDFEPPHVNPINLNPGAEPELNKLSGEAFVDKHMADLIQRVTMVQYVAGDLLVEEMIPDELYSRILMASPSQVQMRLMFDAVQVGGTTVKSAFYKALLNHEPRLVQDLGKIKLLLSPVAQLVEHGACNARIVGLIPRSTHS
ncbi:uncharacterized protein isoform X7 [Salmo salar]|uniref:Uncharacterized protein isoform X7 n=1 Tax=Salmo salar TaxID=8030 RepID=A0ABM3EKJ3_SALSA|nr:uncharacterized protein LOC106601847 isoform X7 [Salmo salar]